MPAVTNCRRNFKLYPSIRKGNWACHIHTHHTRIYFSTKCMVQIALGLNVNKLDLYVIDKLKTVNIMSTHDFFREEKNYFGNIVKMIN